MAQQVLECLNGSLSAEPNVRVSSELRLAELFVNPDTALTLSSIVNAQENSEPIRQITSVLLRKYVKERWSPYFSSFKGNAPPTEAKAQIRGLLFRGLSDPSSKIRSSCAHTISTIANSDWPDEYPDLLHNLISLLSSGSQDSVHGAMRVFSEFIKADLSEDQILPVLRELLPVLLSILGSTQYTPLTRARTVSVFRQCVAALFMVKDQHPQSVKEATGSILPVWIEAFSVLLNIDVRQDIENTDNWDSLAIRKEIFKTLDTIHTSFHRALTQYLPDLLSSAISHLNTLLPTFSTYYISSTLTPPSSSEDEPIQLAEVVCPLIDFVSAVVRGGKAKAWMTPENTSSLVSATLGWIQMTNDDEDNWASDANAFVAQEEDETSSYSIRVAGLDFFSHLIDREPVQTTRILADSVTNIVSQSQQTRAAGNADWWRPLEAALAAVGTLSESILDVIDDEKDSQRPAPIQIEPLLSDVIPSLLTLSECPFLQGRSFVFASQYARLLPAGYADQYLKAAVEVLEAPEASIPIKVSAVKAIQNFYERMEDHVLVPLAPRIAQDLGPFLLVTSEDTLSLVLETLENVVQVDKGKWLDVNLATALTQAILEVWARNNKDPLFISILTDILTALASAPKPSVYKGVVDKALPTLCEAILTSKPEESWIASSAIELATGLIEGAPADVVPIEGYFSPLATSLFTCLNTAEDRDLLQNGVICLTWVVRKDCQQLLDWKGGDGQSGIEHVLRVVAKLLNNEDESGGLVIGDLIIHLLRRASGAVLPVLPDLLQAMVRRMVTSKTATFVQSLVIPFAFLIRTERDTVLDLLESTNVGGRSGLDILIQTWCENAETFQGFWPTRISTLGLCQLVAAERSSLSKLIVKGDMIINPETRNVIITRSKSKQTPHQFSSIPFPVKALKILIHDLQSSGESGAISKPDTFDAQSDDGDEDWADEEKIYQGLKEDEFAFLSDMIGPRGAAFDNEDVLDDSDDEDLKQDPVSKMDMKAHVMEFFRVCASRNTNNFSALVEQLNAEEMLVLRQVLGSQ